jgi:Zn-dependent protease
MFNPPVLLHEDDTVTVGWVWDTPVKVKGLTWLPLTQGAVLVVMAWLAGRNQPDRSPAEKMRVAAMTMPVILGSEWCHNLAHVAAAQWIGKPMDALRITWGMPLCVYYDINDASVMPGQHILRSMGGPLVSSTLFLLSMVVQRFSPRDSTLREVANIAAGTNAFLSVVSLLPIPGIDGGAILKWSLVERGHEISEADAIVRRVDAGVGFALTLIAGAAISRGRRFLGLLSSMLALLSFGVALGWINEQE